MIENNRKAKRGPPRRDETCYQLLHDIVIPAGTILRSHKDHVYEAPYGACGKFSINTEPNAHIPREMYKRVVA